MASELKAIDFDLLDSVFGMEFGYVLDFTNITFSEFFKDLNININDPLYCRIGTSKAKRLREFLKVSKNIDAIRVLDALMEYRKAKERRSSLPKLTGELVDEYEDIICRLKGISQNRKSERADEKGNKPDISDSDYQVLKSELLQMVSLSPQPRGYAFEKFLKLLFDKSGLSPRASYKITGEQIDGSFDVDGDTYLLEAKWTSRKIGVGELLAFNGKVGSKTSWSRGLYISECGFSDDGLEAFKMSNSFIICMDGLDLFQILDDRIPLRKVIKAKARIAAETGNCFVRVRDLRERID